MPKTDKELAVELAVAALSAIAHMAPSASIRKPLDGAQINDVLKDCYNAVHSLPVS